MQINFLKVIPASVAISVAISCFSVKSYAQATEKQDSLAVAEQHLGRGDIQSALTVLQKTISDGGASIPLYLLLGRSYVEAGLPRKAEGALLRARELGSPEVTIVPYLAKAYLLQGEYVKARQIIQSVDMVPAHKLEALVIEADAEFAMNNVKAAEGLYRQALKQYPDDFKAYLGLSRIAMRAQKLEVAEALVKEALIKDSDQTMSHYSLGLVQRFRGDFDRAILSFSRAIEIFDGNLLARLERAAIKIDQGGIEAANVDLDYVYATAPNNHMAKYLTAVILAKDKKFQDADALLIEVQALVDSYLPATYVKGLVAFELGYYAQAEMFLKKVVKYKPHNNEIKQVLATAQVRQNKFAAARQTLNVFEARGEALTDPEALGLLGAIAMGLGDTTQGTVYYEKALKYGGSDNKAISNIEGKLAFAWYAAGETEAALNTLSQSAAGGSIRDKAILATMQMRQKQYENSRKTSQDIIKNFPKRALGYNILGTVYLHEKKNDKAIEQFSLALGLKADYYTAKRNRALAYMRQNNLKDAIKDLRAVNDENPSDARTKALLGSALKQSGEVKDAVIYLREAERDLPATAALSSDLAEALLGAGHLEEAIDVARRVAVSFKENPDILERMGHVLLESGDAMRASHTFARLLAYRQEDPDAHLAYGRSLLKAKLYGGARTAFNRVAALVARKNMTLKGLSWYRAELEFFAGRQDRLQALLPALKSDDRPFEISPALMGDILYLQHDFKAAEIAYRSASKSYPNDLRIVIGLSATLEAVDMIDDAVQILNKWLDEHEDDKVAKERIAEFYWRNGNLDKAADAYVSIIKMGINDPMVSANLANIYLELNNPESMKHASYAYRMLTNDPYVIDTHGRALMAHKKPSEAIMVLKRAVKRAPGNAEYHYHLALAYLAKGKVVDLVAELDKALMLDANFKGADDARVKLKIYR